MIKVYKYPLDAGMTYLRKVPATINPLSVKLLNDEPCLWAEVIVDDFSTVDLDVVTVRTGEEFDSAGWTFIDTVVMAGDSLVFHYYCRVGRD